MRSRRELFALGGAGVAALTLPSFLPTQLAAQGNNPNDPIQAELARQFERVVRGLGAIPPRGNARQLAALFRMTSAWARANNFDATLRQRLDDAIASEGHDALVARLAAVDRVAAGQAAGLPLTPNVQNITDPVAIAKAIGFYKAGLTFERSCRHTAWLLDHYAVQFDNRIAVLNKRQPELLIRRVQDNGCGDADAAGCSDPGNVPPPSGGDCTFSGNTADCVIYGPNVIPEPSLPCSDVWNFFLFYSGIQFDLFMYLLGGLGLWGLLVGFAFDGVLYYVSC